MLVLVLVVAAVVAVAAAGAAAAAAVVVVVVVVVAAVAVTRWVIRGYHRGRSSSTTPGSSSSSSSSSRVGERPRCTMRTTAISTAPCYKEIVRFLASGPSYMGRFINSASFQVLLAPRLLLDYLLVFVAIVGSACDEVQHGSISK